jgi:hypothetical protein
MNLLAVIAAMVFILVMVMRMVHNLCRYFLFQEVSAEQMQKDFDAAYAANDVDKLQYCLIRYGHRIPEHIRKDLKSKIDKAWLEKHPEIIP